MQNSGILGGMIIITNFDIIEKYKILKIEL